MVLDSCKRTVTVAALALTVSVAPGMSQASDANNLILRDMITHSLGSETSLCGRHDRRVALALRLAATLSSVQAAASKRCGGSSPTNSARPVQRTSASCPLLSSVIAVMLSTQSPSLA